MQDSHTVASVAETTADPSPLRLVSASTAGLPEWLAGRVDEHLAAFVAHMRQGLLAASTAVGLEVMDELMAVEVTHRAGPRGKHNPQRVAMRHGTQPGTVTLGGRRVPIRRPRVRTTGEGAHELELESYREFASTDLLARASWPGCWPGCPPAATRPGWNRSASRCSRLRLARPSRVCRAGSWRRPPSGSMLARRLDDRRWLVVFLDGFGMGEHLLVGALGVTEDGTKVPLGVVEGTTENKAVCTRLVADLAERGLDASRGVLMVIEGGKALDRAIHAVFGAKALIQRCRRHKERNVTEHLPEAERPLVQRRLRAAWQLGDADQAKAELERLARSLDRKRPGAAASLREGLEQTLTVTRLGVDGSLLQTVESTNPVESMIEIVRDHAGRVKRWSSGEMALRWAAAGMGAAEGQFRRVKGYRELPQLAAALERATAEEPGPLDLPATVGA
jgi:putative transposase